MAVTLPACFVVRDHDGQQLAHVYFEGKPGRRSAAKLLSKDEARRIAANIAKLPENANSTGNFSQCSSRAPISLHSHLGTAHTANSA